jgi:class 3 adenylate cyclase
VTPDTLFLKDPAAARFVSGGLAEVEALLGTPLPRLPRPEMDGGDGLYLVRFHPRLRTLLVKFLQGLLADISGTATAARTEARAKEQAEYESGLLRILRSVRLTDRRQGLGNLLWLAHTRDAAETIKDLERKTPAVRKLKYSLHPLLSSFYRRVEQAARRESERESPEREAFLKGAGENPALVDGLIDDGFAFTELSIGDLDFNQFLAANKRYRLSAELFFEIYSLLVRETERRLRESERGLTTRIARYLPDLPREQCQSPQGLAKVMLNSQVLSYLLADAWNTGAKLMASARLKAESERRRPAEIMDAFLDLIAGVKRFELLAHLRDRVSLVDPFQADRATEDRITRGLRVYEFGDSAQVLNNALNATVVFLDLRGFTKTSEGQISERDLTRELYLVFDAFTALALRFGGTVDKFLGDGMMVTFGTDQHDPLDPLNALRLAVLAQETLARMRQEGQTYFKMGISIHYGRVYLARFIADERAVHTTVIGRNVNLAGRLSSAAKRAIDEDENGEAGEEEVPVATSRTGLQVLLDEHGALFNEGIVLSRDALAQLEAHLPLTQAPEAIEYEYFDEAIGRRFCIHYVGDAKFKGVRSSVPVYSVDYEV